MNKILLTGGSSLLTINWVSYSLNKNFVLGFNNRILNIKNTSSILLNLEKKNILEKQLRKLNIKIVIHTAGMTDVDKCEKYIKNCKRINFDYTKNLSDVCKKLNLYLVFISTDQLFDGKKKLYYEESKCLPLNVYSKFKYLSEEYIKNNNNKFLIIRTNFFGNGPIYRKSYSDYILDNLKKKNKINLAKDIFFSPISTKYLTKYINLLIKKKCKRHL